MHLTSSCLQVKAYLDIPLNYYFTVAYSKNGKSYWGGGTISTAFKISTLTKPKITFWNVEKRAYHWGGPVVEWKGREIMTENALGSCWLKNDVLW